MDNPIYRLYVGQMVVWNTNWKGPFNMKAAEYRSKFGNGPYPIKEIIDAETDQPETATTVHRFIRLEGCDIAFPEVYFWSAN